MNTEEIKQRLMASTGIHALLSIYAMQDRTPKEIPTIQSKIARDEL